MYTKGTNRNTRVNVTCTAATTVAELMASVARSEGIPEDQQVIFVNGHRLEDPNQRLGDVGVGPGTTVHLVIQTRRAPAAQHIAEASAAATAAAAPLQQQPLSAHVQVATMAPQMVPQQQPHAQSLQQLQVPYVVPFATQSQMQEQQQQQQQQPQIQPRFTSYTPPS